MPSHRKPTPSSDIESSTPSLPTSQHIAVLAEEVVRYLEPRAGQVFVDGTFGGGGHTRLLAEQVGPRGLVIALDRDQAALERGAVALAGLPVKLVQSDFRDLPEVLEEVQIEQVDGVLLDLGLSSDQLADAARGFSFDADGPLDLRFDPTSGEPAWRLVNRLSAKHLADLIYAYGEERLSRRIARRIVETRREKPIRTADELAKLVRQCSPRQPRRGIDPATRTFQALRIAVNDELGALDQTLKRLPGCIRPGGRAAIISFHSLEDRRVKTAFRHDSHYEPLTKRPITASEQEQARNRRSRSAKLRVAEIRAVDDSETC